MLPAVNSSTRARTPKPLMTEAIATLIGVVVPDPRGWYRR
jgi:hypothetical protein